MRTMSLARQLLLLQLVVVAVTVAVVGAFAARTTTSRTDDQQRDRARSVAEALAASADVRAALRTPDPSARLQPLAETVRRRAGLGFVVFMSPDGIRYSHPSPEEIGRRYIGAITGAQQGRTITERRTGTLGNSVRAVAPIEEDGRVVALVAVGVLQEAIADQVRDQLPGLGVSLLIALAAGAALCLALARRVQRQTRGLDPQELTALYEHHDAVLQAIKEGVVAVDPAGRLRLANDEAARLLDLPADAVGRDVSELVDPDLAARLRGEDEADTHVSRGRVLFSSHRQTPAGDTVTTLRDRTELEAAMRELVTVRGLADALRAQAHESANELHTVVGLVELGRYEDAVAFATRRIGVTQDEVDRVQSRIGDPALAALLLAKASVCRERGVELEVGPESALSAGVLDGEDLVTIAGNLIDNALDALDGRGGRITVLAQEAGGTVTLEVRDTGPGVPDTGRVFDAGWTTKEGDRPRGLGLALVRATAERLGGTATVTNDGGAVFRVTLPTGVRA